MNNFIIGRFVKMLGGQKDGSFYDATGAKCSVVVVVEEDQSYTPKGKEKVERLAQIPFKFFGKEAERLANLPDHYNGQMVKVDFALGGYNPEGDKWYPNLNGKWLHTWEGQKLEEIPFGEPAKDEPPY